MEIEKNKTTKAALVQALKDSVTYCNKAYDGLTDAAALQTVKVMGGDNAKLTVCRSTTSTTQGTTATSSRTCG